MVQLGPKHLAPAPDIPSDGFYGQVDIFIKAADKVRFIRSETTERIIAYEYIRRVYDHIDYKSVNRYNSWFIQK